jgi:hypothetical protein
LIHRETPYYNGVFYFPNTCPPTFVDSLQEFSYGVSPYYFKNKLRKDLVESNIHFIFTQPIKTTMMKRQTKREEYITILLESENFSGTDLPYLNNLTTDQLKGLVVRDDEELIEDPEMCGFRDD